MKLLKIIGLILGTVLIAYLSGWALQEDKNKPPTFNTSKPDRDGKPPGKH